MTIDSYDNPALAAPRRGLTRWPLFLIASPAAVAVWSGWVGLGALCGFGIVHPLPGIADGFRLNTAITLPVGVEAYGAYALGAWLHPGHPAAARSSPAARRSARWCSAWPGRSSTTCWPPRMRHRAPVAGRDAGLLPAGGHPRLRRRAHPPAAPRPRRTGPAPEPVRRPGSVQPAQQPVLPGTVTGPPEYDAPDRTGRPTGRAAAPPAYGGPGRGRRRARRADPLTRRAGERWRPDYHASDGTHGLPPVLVRESRPGRPQGRARRHAAPPVRANHDTRA